MILGFPLDGRGTSQLCDPVRVELPTPDTVGRHGGLAAGFARWMCPERWMFLWLVPAPPELLWREPVLVEVSPRS
jgi:hypothetical protein